MTCWDCLLSWSVEISCWASVLNCWDYLLGSAVEIICRDQPSRWFDKTIVEIIGWDKLWKLSVEFSCRDDLLTTAVNIICWKHLLISSVEINPSNELLRLTVEILCWTVETIWLNQLLGLWRTSRQLKQEQTRNEWMNQSIKQSID